MLEASSAFQSFKNNLINFNIPMFNDRFLSKKEVHNLLFSEDHMHPYLPDTAIADEQTIKEMLARHRLIFLKPIHGSQGRNIIRLSIQDEEIMTEVSTGNGRKIRSHSKIMTVLHNGSSSTKRKQFFWHSRPYLCKLIRTGSLISACSAIKTFRISGGPLLQWQGFLPNSNLFPILQEAGKL